MNEVIVAVEPLAVTDKEAARMLSIGASTLRQHAKEGKLPAPIRIGGATRWRVADLRRWLESSCPTTP